MQFLEEHNIELRDDEIVDIEELNQWVSKKWLMK
jgi:hypothetical protein